MSARWSVQRTEPHLCCSQHIAGGHERAGAVLKGPPDQRHPGVVGSVVLAAVQLQAGRYRAGRGSRDGAAQLLARQGGMGRGVEGMVLYSRQKGSKGEGGAGGDQGEGEETQRAGKIWDGGRRGTWGPARRPCRAMPSALSEAPPRCCTASHRHVLAPPPRTLLINKNNNQGTNGDGRNRPTSGYVCWHQSSWSPAATLSTQHWYWPLSVGLTEAQEEPGGL